MLDCETNTRKQFFVRRAVTVWNSLPAATTKFTSLTAFKASLQNINLRVFTRF